MEVPAGTSARMAARTKTRGSAKNVSMWGMAGMGSVITVSTRGGPGRFERQARARIARDGVTRLAAETSNGRQRRLLEQVRHLLAADPALDVFGPSDHGDGFSYVWVHPAGAKHAAIWGQPNGAAGDDDPDDIDVQVLDDLF